MGDNLLDIMLLINLLHVRCFQWCLGWSGSGVLHVTVNSLEHRLLTGILIDPIGNKFITNFMGYPVLQLGPVPIAQVVELPLREREVVGSKPGRAIPKALKMVPVATLLGAQHYKASIGFSHSLLTQLTLHEKKTNPQHLVHWNPSVVPLGG